MPNKTAIQNKVLHHSDGSYITYRQIKGSSPAVFYLHGTQSSIDSTKAAFVEKFCLDNDIGFTSLNFRGHGDSWGEYTNGNISMWLADALAVLDQATSGSQLVIGSSMGGWIMLLLAMRRPDRVKGMIGLAAAPDFTVRLWNALPDTMKKEMQETGLIHLPSEYSAKGEPFTYDLIQDGNNNLVLHHNITTDAKVILIQGEQDICVPSEICDKIKAALTSPDVKVIKIKDGKHNLSTPEQLRILSDAIVELRREMT